ncbi:hypothetical protein K8R43_03800 [archaeon]|nr:hypothetical protein [archaeon]
MTPCTNSFQTRECTDSNKCGSISNKPKTRISCTDSSSKPECESNSDCYKDHPCVLGACIDGDCDYTIINQCKTGDGCCPVGCKENNDGDCGQGGNDCTTDDDCPPTGSCITVSCTLGFCRYSPETACVGGDGCCPSNCGASNDPDCSELATSCNIDKDCFDGIVCTADACVSGECVRTPITSCDSSSQDGCCPDTCNKDNDADCGECKTASDCNDGFACTMDTCSGIPPSCTHLPIVSCGASDTCCPFGCSSEQGSNYDPDCTGKACINSFECDDSIDCTIDLCSDGTCEYTQITQCIEGDMCCPTGCTYENDADCPFIDPCDNDADCEDDNPCSYNERCVDGNCQADYLDCGPSDGCCPATCYATPTNPGEHYGGDPDCPLA